MNDDPFATEMRRYLREMMNELADIAACGGCQEWGAYQRLVGKIEGLAVAERHLIDLIERQRENE